MPPPPFNYDLSSTVYEASRFRTFQEALTAAIADFAEHGYDEERRIEYWTAILRELAGRKLGPVETREAIVTRSLQVIYDREVKRERILKQHPEVPKFTLQRIAPELRGELDRRIVASTNLIKLNREKRIEKVLQRFQGWATSIPVGGSRAIEKREVKKNIGKSLDQMEYVERRVAVDQGHKLISNISEVLANQSDAIAGTWHQHWTYQPRKEHTERDGKVYAIHGDSGRFPHTNWALKEGLMTKGAGYLEDMSAAGEEINCRCSVTFWTDLATIAKMAPEMITKKGWEYLGIKKAA